MPFHIVRHAAMFHGNFVKLVNGFIISDIIPKIVALKLSRRSF